MIITRTPYRVSFFGGGSDYPAWYKHHGGAVLGATIDKYCWITVRRPPTFFGPRYKLVYGKTEEETCIREIDHPAIRATLEDLGYPERLEVIHTSDLPARSGVGSSSAFVVGLVKAVAELDKDFWESEGLCWTRSKVAEQAVYIEQEKLKETVGCQDQHLCALGGLNVATISTSGAVSVKPAFADPKAEALAAARLNENLMLFWTKVQRTASDVASGYVRDLPKHEKAMHRLVDMVYQGVDALRSALAGGSLDAFGALLDEAWVLKKSLGAGITTGEIDSWYNRAKEEGALGGKMLGAGGGGFLLLYVPPDRQDAVRCALTGLAEVPFKFEDEGVTVVYNSQERAAA